MLTYKINETWCNPNNYTAECMKEGPGVHVLHSYRNDIIYYKNYMVIPDAIGFAIRIRRTSNLYNYAYYNHSSKPPMLYVSYDYHAFRFTDDITKINMSMTKLQVYDYGADVKNQLNHLNSKGH